MGFSGVGEGVQEVQLHPLGNYKLNNCCRPQIEGDVGGVREV